MKDYIADLACEHVARGFAAAPSVFAARLAIIFPPEGPEFRCHGSGASTRLVKRVFTATNVSATALVRIGRFIHPREFGAMASMLTPE